MKFSTSKTELQKALQKVSKAIPTRSTLPILSCLLISTTKKGTLFRTTDLEITIQAELPVSVEEEGAACLPIKTLLNITNELPETRVTISVKSQKAKIKTDFGEYDLMSKHADEFPEIPKIGTKQSFNFDK